MQCFIEYVLSQLPCHTQSEVPMGERETFLFISGANIHLEAEEEETSFLERGETQTNTASRYWVGWLCGGCQWPHCKAVQYVTARLFIAYKNGRDRATFYSKPNSIQSSPFRLEPEWGRNPFRSETIETVRTPADNSNTFFGLSI